MAERGMIFFTQAIMEFLRVEGGHRHPFNPPSLCLCMYIEEMLPKDASERALARF
jgi:hypothetical protein